MYVYDTVHCTTHINNKYNIHIFITFINVIFLDLFTHENYNDWIITLLLLLLLEKKKNVPNCIDIYIHKFFLFYK